MACRIQSSWLVPEWSLWPAQCRVHGHHDPPMASHLVPSMMVLWGPPAVWQKDAGAVQFRVLAFYCKIYYCCTSGRQDKLPSKGLQIRCLLVLQMGSFTHLHRARLGNWHLHGDKFPPSSGRRCFGLCKPCWQTLYTISTRLDAHREPLLSHHTYRPPFRSAHGFALTGTLLLPNMPSVALHWYHTYLMGHYRSRYIALLPQRTFFFFN